MNSYQITGPTRYKPPESRISVPYELIDLRRSRKRSFPKKGVIVTKHGDKILVYSLYFSMSEEKRIFVELSSRCHRRDTRKEGAVIKL